MLTTTADANLVALTLDGDDHAFATLLERHERRFKHVAYKVLGMTQEADDAMQDAFLNGYRKLASLAQPERFASWMCRIIYHAAVMWLRRNRSRVTVPIQEELDEVQGPEPIVERAEESTVVRVCLSKLSPSYQEVLRLKYEGQLSYEEMADRLSTTRVNVEKRLYRARRKLEAVVRQHELFAVA